MKESLGQIRQRFKEARPFELPALAEAYREDEREGVRRLVESAWKRMEAYEKEKQRIERLKQYEKQYASSYACICGIDEVGRGPLAGPVVAGAVILPRDCDILYINDSKQLTEKRREELYGVIREKAVACSVGYASPRRIDEINILQATYEAMRRAIASLKVRPDLLLNDAVTIPGVPIRQVPIIKGDAKSISIGAASILAKVERDRLMVKYDRIYPQYGFGSNKGYGSAEHIMALRKYGACPIHRQSFIHSFVDGKARQGAYGE